MTHPLAHWRVHYPILSTKTYLVSHSLGAVPSSTAQVLSDYHEQWATLGVGAWDGPWWNEVTDFCARIEQLLDADAGTVAPFQNSTRAMAGVASCFDFQGPRNRIVLTDLEFTSSYPFWRGCERLGAEIVLAKSDDGLTVSMDAFDAVLDERVLLVPTSHVYFRSGALADLAELTRRAHAVGAMVLGDGYQAVGAVPFSVRDMNIDFYVGGCHKYLSGGAGAGFLYVRPDHVSALEPRLTGWFGLANPFSYEDRTDEGERHPGVWRFLAGTPNVPALYAARDGLKNVLEAGMPAIREVSTQLTSALIDHATGRGLTVRTPTDPAQRSGMVCIDFDGADVACKALEDRGVQTDYRPGCGLRVSPHFYNTPEDLDAFWRHLDEIRAS